jgi:hypothetical protein
MSAILGLLSDRKLGSLDFQGLYAGNNSIINTGGTSSNHVSDAKNGADRRKISDKQARWLHGLVERIARAERAKDPGFREAKVWVALHEHMNVEHYKDIAMADFDVAKAWLVGWLSSV